MTDESTPEPKPDALADAARSWVERLYGEPEAEIDARLKSLATIYEVTPKQARAAYDAALLATPDDELPVNMGIDLRDPVEPSANGGGR
jgi:hypothetical protein